jgi:hypothetical protein
MPNPSFSLQTLPFVLLVLLALYAPTTLAMPQPAASVPPSLGPLSRRALDAGQASTRASLWRSVRKNCNRHNTCSDWVEGPNFPSFEEAPYKQAKVDARKKKKQDPENEDDFCAGEVCGNTEECVKMRGHEREPAARQERWWTCCPRKLPVAGYKGMCCEEVNESGVCVA